MRTAAGLKPPALHLNL